MKLTAHFHLQPWLRMPALPHTFSWCRAYLGTTKIYYARGPKDLCNYADFRTGWRCLLNERKRRCAGQTESKLIYETETFKILQQEHDFTATVKLEMWEDSLLNATLKEKMTQQRRPICPTSYLNGLHINKFYKSRKASGLDNITN